MMVDWSGRVYVGHQNVDVISINVSNYENHRLGSIDSSKYAVPILRMGHDNTVPR
jgi:hypothetical protein